MHSSAVQKVKLKQYNFTSQILTQILKVKAKKLTARLAIASAFRVNFELELSFRFAIRSLWLLFFRVLLVLCRFLRLVDCIFGVAVLESKILLLDFVFCHRFLGLFLGGTRFEILVSKAYFLG